MDLSDIPLNQGARGAIPDSATSDVRSAGAGGFDIALGGPRVGRKWEISQVNVSLTNLAVHGGFNNIASGHYDPTQLAIMFALVVNNLDRMSLGEVVFGIDHIAGGSPNPGVDTYYFTGDQSDLAADPNNTLEIAPGGFVTLSAAWQWRPVKTGTVGYGSTVAVDGGNISVTLKGRNARV